MSNYVYGSLSLKICEKGLLIRGSLVQAHPEAQESQEQSWDFLLHKAFVYKAYHDFLLLLNVYDSSVIIAQKSDISPIRVTCLKVSGF